MPHPVVLIFLLAAAAHQGSAIKCYQCTSKTNEACKDPWSGSPDLKPTDCLPNMAWSTKSLNDVLPGSVSKFLDSMGSSISNLGSSITPEMICMKTSIRSGEELVVMRHCAVSTAPSDIQAPKGSGVCDQVKSASDGKAEYCGVCDYDGCNAAPPRHTSTQLLIFLAPLLALFLKVA